MNAPAKAVFSFSNFRIIEFSLKDCDFSLGLQAQFDPHGEYDPNTGQFTLTLLYDNFMKENEVPVLSAKMIADFSFADKIPSTLEEIPPYFYANAIAITFPYLRSFVTSLTAQALLKPIIMPLFNLTGLEPIFREQTKII